MEQKDKDQQDKEIRSDVEGGGQINYRNSNESSDDLIANEPNVERANSAGMGDSGVNDARMTKYTSNHSGDA